VSSTRTSTELGTTRSIYASTVVGTVIPLTHWLPRSAWQTRRTGATPDQDLAFPVCRYAL